MAESELISGKSSTITLSDVKLYSKSEWESFKKEYQKNGYKYSIFNSRSIESASATLTRHMNKALGRYYIAWYCQQSGIFKTRGTGKRSIGTIKTNCPAFIKFNIDTSGQFLAVTRSCEMHNHSANERPLRKSVGIPKNNGSDKLESVASGINACNESQPTELPLDLTVSNEIIFDDFVPVVSASKLPSNTRHQILGDSICNDSSTPGLVTIYDFPAPPQSTSTPVLKKSKQHSTAAKRSITTTTVAPMNDKPLITTENQQVDQIIMPITVKTRGRPKGKKNTAGGVHMLKGPINFDKQSESSKKRLIMSWLMPQKYVTPSLMGEYDITRRDLKNFEAAGLSDALIDISVDIDLIKEHFERDAWEYLMALMNEKKEKNIVTCYSCKGALSEQKRVCKGCKLGYHIMCIVKKTWKDGFCCYCQ